MVPQPKFDAVGFGALNLDLTYRVDDDLLDELELQPGEEVWSDDPPDGLLSKLAGRSQRLGHSGGGSAANTMVAMARAGYRVTYIGKVGSDPHGEFLLKDLKNERVDISGIRQGGRSGLCVTLVSSSIRDRVLLVFPGTNDTLQYMDMHLGIANQSRLLHLTSFVGDTPFEAQKALIAKLDSKVLVSFDPGMIYARRGLSDLRPILARTDVMLPSESDVEILTGLPWKKGCARLREEGPSVVACTLGARGSFVMSDEGSFFRSAVPFLAQDTTGAGDVYAAGFLAGILAGKSLQDCARHASLWSSQSATGVGRSAYPMVSDSGLSQQS